MDNYEAVDRGRRAHLLLDNTEWQEAWEAYRATLLREIEAAGPRDTETVMHCKRLLTAAQAAKAHLERMVSDGVVAGKTIEVLTKRQQMSKKVRAWL